MKPNEPRHFSMKYKQTTIHGGLVENHDLVGYCHYIGHKGYLLQKHLKDHNCIPRNCHYFEKNHASRYFITIDFVKQKRTFAKRLKQLFQANVITASQYMMYDETLKSVSTQTGLDAFCQQRLQIEVCLQTLLNLNTKGGDLCVSSTSYSQ